MELARESGDKFMVFSISWAEIIATPSSWMVTRYFHAILAKRTIIHHTDNQVCVRLSECLQPRAKPTQPLWSNEPKVRHFAKTLDGRFRSLA